MRQMISASVAIVLAVIMAGCGGAAQPAATATVRPLPPRVATSAATATPAPTNTPEPTKTPTPTAQPTIQPPDEPTSPPTDTPTPTHTPTPEATPTPEVVITPIGGITADQSGQEVTVEGNVVGTASFSNGFKFTLDDGTGQIVLLMWHNVYDDCWDAPEINLGAKVRATGKVNQYEGALEIEPGFGGDVKAIEGATATGTPREIGSLGGGDAGLRVMIEGEVVRVEGLSSAVKVFVGDGTGEVVVYLWRNVLDRIPDSTGLGTPGSRVRVVGVVDVYRSNLEVVPTIPYDVTVLEIAGQ